MKVCLFGTYSRDEGYPRTRVIRDALTAADVEVIECHAHFWPDERVKTRTVGRGRVRLLLAGVRLAFVWAILWRRFRAAPQCDLVLVGYPGQLDVFWAKRLARKWKAPVVLDAFLSLEEALVDDRRLYAPDSVEARLVRWLDGASARTADRVLLDTAEHIRALCSAHTLTRDKFIRVPVGSDTALRTALESGECAGPHLETQSGVCEILYCGTYLPFHGVDVIVEALALLTERGDEAPPVHVTLLGTGPELARVQTLVRDRRLTGLSMLSYWAAPAEYARRLTAADIALGVFGAGDKTQRVVPCKIYDALAAGTPVLTADSPAVQEFLTPDETVFTCTANDPASLAAAVARVAADAPLRAAVGKAGHDLYHREFSPDAIGAQLLSELTALTEQGRSHGKRG